MKKALRIISLTLLSIIIIGIFGSYFAYSRYWAEDKDVDIIPQNLDYYHETYDECRTAFKEKAEDIKEQYDNVVVDKFFVESAVDSNLTVDWCYIPAQVKSDKLLIINSGLHGIEGYTGSAIQRMFMEQLLPNTNLDSMGILLIHSINPYGFKYHRKVTENNVDLNRNCVVEQKMFESENDGYDKLTPLLMPEGKVSLSNLRNRFFHLLAITKIIQESMPVLRQAALQGQYEFSRGIYYGGKEYEPQINLLKPLLIKIMAQYNTVLNVDLHTAYGERGKMHLFLNPIDDTAVVNSIETVFAGAEIDWGSGEDFYTINGEYIGWVKNLSKNERYIPMLFEFGTLDSQTTFGSLKSIQIMINENQGVHWGYKNDKQEQKAKALFDEMYYPTSPAWRSKVISDAKSTMSGMLLNFERL